MTQTNSKSYKELLADAQAILAEAEQLRVQERGNAIQKIREIMAENGLTIEDLGGSQKQGGTKKASKSKAAAKYRGPNGELWAGGLGRKPEWVRTLLAEGKSIDDYLI